MSAKPERPILIVKRVKRSEQAPHSGAWKVAYADFVTAMMAFFLVMWLIASVSKEQRAAIFQYFKNPSMETGKSTRPAPAQAGPGGASTSMINFGGAMDARLSASPLTKGLGTPNDAQVPLPHENAAVSSEQQARQIMEAAEHKRLESLMAELRQAIDNSQALKPFKDQLLLDITPEGLRIQIVDAQNRPMFDLGSAKLKPYTAGILRVLAPYLNTVPNRLSLSGHTDTTPYTAQAGYNNWDLSADRANAARRALESGGLSPDKVARIVGLSSAVLFDKANPRDAINRRISIIVMTKDAEEAALKTDSSAPVPPTALAPALRTDSSAARSPAAAAPSSTAGASGAKPTSAPASASTPAGPGPTGGASPASAASPATGANPAGGGAAAATR